MLPAQSAAARPTRRGDAGGRRGANRGRGHRSRDESPHVHAGRGSRRPVRTLRHDGRGIRQGELMYGPEEVGEVSRAIAGWGFTWTPEEIRVWQEGSVAWAQILGELVTGRDGVEASVPDPLHHPQPALQRLDPPPPGTIRNATPGSVAKLMSPKPSAICSTPSTTASWPPVGRSSRRD